MRKVALVMALLFISMVGVAIAAPASAEESPSVSPSATASPSASPTEEFLPCPDEGFVVVGPDDPQNYGPDCTVLAENTPGNGLPVEPTPAEPTAQASKEAKAQNQPVQPVRKTLAQTGPVSVVVLTAGAWILVAGILMVVVGSRLPRPNKSDYTED